MEQKRRLNCHLEHIEDLFFGTTMFEPITQMENIVDYITGSINDMSISVKWDGAPAFVCGPHPETGKFFIGTKSVFSGKINYCHEDIDKNHPEPDLNKKLHVLFTEFQFLKWNNIVQGDLLWVGIDGYCFNHTMQFRPNTLKYRMKLPATHNIPGVGAVIHTSYYGENMDTLVAHSVGYSDVPHTSNNVHIFTPMIATLDHDMVLNIELFDKIKKDAISKYPYSEEETDILLSGYVQECFHKYINSCYAKSKYIHYMHFLIELAYKYDNHCDMLKTEKGKNKIIKEKNRVFGILTETGVARFFEYYQNLIAMKNVLIEALDHMTAEGIDIELPDGTKCGHEGYVVDNYRKMFKIVDRKVFSKANFNTPKVWNA